MNNFVDFIGNSEFLMKEELVSHMGQSPYFDSQYSALNNLVRQVNGQGSLLRPLAYFELIVKNKDFRSKGFIIKNLSVVNVGDKARIYWERDLNESIMLHQWEKVSLVEVTSKKCGNKRQLL